MSALTRRLSARFVFAVVLTALCLALQAGTAFAVQVTLAWDPVESPGIAGYRLYYGTLSGDYAQSVEIGLSTSVTIADLSEGETYYFASVSYDALGIESSYSNELAFTVPAQDSDADGLTDSQEASYGTNAYATDTDGDGLSDAQEVNFWGQDWNADFDHDGLINLIDADSDGDGMADGWEAANGLNAGVNDAALDNDGDGRSNLQEYLDGTDPNTREGRTAQQIQSSMSAVRLLCLGS